MQFTSVLLSCLSIGFAIAASDVTVHVVQVGNRNGTLEYTPNNIVAAVGDMVQYQFNPENHSVVQSTFGQPCQPIALNSNVTGIFSGFMPVSANSSTVPTYTIVINNTTPIWIYCAQAEHCQKGMVMVINENTTANATRSLANYQALAAKATANLAPGETADGTAGTASSGSSSSSSTGSSSSSSGSSSSTPAASTSAAQVLKASESYGLVGLLALGFVLFI